MTLAERRRLLLAGNQFPYRFVEWIENTGDTNSWIELNIVPSNTFGYKAILSLAERTGDVYVFGTREDTNKRILFSSYSSTKQCYFGWGANVSTVNIAPVVEWGTPFDISFNYKNSRYAYINDKNVWDGTQITALGFSPTWKFVILGRRTTSNTRGVKQRLYEMQITQGSSVVMDLQPCYRVSDGAIGMYDVLNDVFYGNSGTGSLSKGPDRLARTNTLTGINEFLGVAETYLNKNSIEYNDGNTPIWLTTQTNGIDCSTFVMFCLLGIPFSKSPYYTNTYGGPYALSANTSDYEWAIDPMMWQCSRYIDNTNPDEMVRLACQLGRWMEGRYFVVPINNGFREVQPGDIVFWGRKNTNDEWVRPDWYRHINHVGIVLSKEPAPDTYEYTQDGETVTADWDKEKYPYKHTIIDSVNVTPPVRTALWLEKGQEDPSNVYYLNCNTVQLIVRPNLHTT